MNALGAHLRNILAREGEITVARYMAEALGHSEHGYYIRRDPLGAAGDFTTAPEISQMFGELLGLWCVETWERMGAPARVVLAELGPGRGTLMADALRAARRRPAFREALALHLVETSPVLRAEQARRLVDAQAQWHEDVAQLPPGPAIVLANEFLDALPVRQFVRASTGWRERVVVWSENAQHFEFSASRSETAANIPFLPCKAPDGAIYEHAPAANTLVATLARRLAAEGGAALFVDYGYALSPDEARNWSGSLQAVRRHEFVDPLAEPGECDLTAHVDFAALREAARNAGGRAHGPVAQGAFLSALGIATRAESLAAKAEPQARAAIAAALHRLTAAREMGALFKAFAISDQHLGSLAGFP
ncbi:MAG: class I SAM-dependent methyltransferase [Alphaproteobacteria bacterium]